MGVLDDVLDNGHFELKGAFDDSISKQNDVVILDRRQAAFLLRHRIEPRHRFQCDGCYEKAVEVE